MDTSIQLQIWLVILSIIGSVSRVQQVAAEEEEGAIAIDPNWEAGNNNNGGGSDGGDSHPQDPENVVVLQSPTVTNWGKWGPFAHCSMKHSYVTGFQLKVETKETGIDNTAVNGISLSCGIPEQQEIERIKSATGYWGTGRTRHFCAKGPAVGFQLKVQRSQGRGIDDAATVNVKMICGNGQILEGFDEQGDYYVDTEWSEPMICPDNTAVCGIRTQIEPRRWLGDDTSLNNIRIKCCPLPPPLEDLVSTTTQVVTDSSLVTSTSASNVSADYKLTVFKSQQGSGLNETLAITDGKCNNLPFQWEGEVGSFVKETRCLRLWQGYDCSGATRCYCDDDFLSLNERYTMTKYFSWYQQLSSVGPCQIGENLEGRHAKALLFSEVGYEGDMTKIVLAPGECLTFYEGDQWRGKIVSTIVNKGCINLYEGEECTGDKTSVDSAMSYPFIGKNWAKRAVAIKNCWD